jgi:hypothetical protein
MHLRTNRHRRRSSRARNRAPLLPLPPRWLSGVCVPACSRIILSEYSFVANEQ